MEIPLESGAHGPFHVLQPSRSSPHLGDGKPLRGVRILDLSRVLAGPYLTQALADLGAEVWKVEQPGKGDDTRAWGPPFVHRNAEPGVEDPRLSAAYFWSCNRNKKSICVDMATPEGQQILQELARCSDAVVENFKVGGLAKYHLDYASLSALHPGLVYCSITGYGQTGPKAHEAGYDYAIQATSGLMSITGPEE